MLASIADSAATAAAFLLLLLLLLLASAVGAAAAAAAAALFVGPEKVEKRQLRVQPFEWLKLNFAKKKGLRVPRQLTFCVEIEAGTRHG